MLVAVPRPEYMPFQAKPRPRAAPSARTPIAMVQSAENWLPQNLTLALSDKCPRIAAETLGRANW